jgi:hypothetical protein
MDERDMEEERKDRKRKVWGNWRDRRIHKCARNLFAETRNNISFRNSPLAKHTIYFLVPSWNCSLAINTNSKNLFDLLCTS